MNYITEHTWWYIFDKSARESNAMVFVRGFMSLPKPSQLYYFLFSYSKWALLTKTSQLTETKKTVLYKTAGRVIWEKLSKESLSFLLSSFGTVVHMLKLVYHLQYCVLCHCCTWCIQSGLNGIMCHKALCACCCFLQWVSLIALIND